MTDHREIIQLLGEYLNAYPRNSRINEKGFLLYAEALEDLPMPDIRRAMKLLLKKSAFFPSVAEIRETAGYGDRYTPEEEMALRHKRNLEQEAESDGLTPEERLARLAGDYDGTAK